MPLTRPFAFILALSLASGFASPAALAQSQGESGASIVTGEEETEGAPSSSSEGSTSASTDDPSGIVVDDEPDTEGHGLLGPVRVGALVSAGIPQFLHYSLESRLWRVAGLGVGFGGVSTKAEDIEIKLRNWAVRARWFPFEGSLFLGASLGSSTYDAKLKRDLKVAFAGQSRTVPTTFKADVTRSELTPMLGWQWIFGSGFTLGLDLGWQIATSSKSNFSVEPEGLTAQEKELIKEQPEYQANEKKVKDDFLDRYKDSSLPHVALGIGWMF